MILRELGHMTGGKRDDPIMLLIFASMFRDELPWVYELGLEAYKAARGGRSAEANRTLQRFRHAVEAMMHGPFPIEELGLEPRMLHMLWQELEHFAMLGSPVEEEPKPKPRRRKKPKEE